MELTSLRSTSAHVLVDPELFEKASIDDDTEHHLRRVLRLRDGEQVSVTDGAGRWLVATVALGSSLRLERVGDIGIEPAPQHPFTVATAMPKGDRLDWLIQKATELGADRVALLHAERSVVRWKPERVDTQLARLQRISDEACRQSRRVWRVEISAPVEASTVVGEFAIAEPGGRRLRPADRQVAIGPEGGWTPAEVASGRDVVSLGSTILRTETAVAAVCALCVTFER